MALTRNRRACATWHEQHPDYDRERRLRDRVDVISDERLSRALVGEIYRMAT